MSALSLAEDCSVHIQALGVQGTVVTIECPHCWTKYDKYEEKPARFARRVLHEFGIDRSDLRQAPASQTLYRAPHCQGGRFPEGKHGFAIHITSQTPWR